MKKICFFLVSLSIVFSSCEKEIDSISNLPSFDDSKTISSKESSNTFNNKSSPKRKMPNHAAISNMNAPLCIPWNGYCLGYTFRGIIQNLRNAIDENTLPEYLTSELIDSLSSFQNEDDEEASIITKELLIKVKEGQDNYTIVEFPSTTDQRSIAFFAIGKSNLLPDDYEASIVIRE